MAIDPAHPFPFIPSGGFALALSLEKRISKKSLDIILPIPAQLDRFHRLESDNSKQIRLSLLEDILCLFVGIIFPGYDLKIFIEWYKEFYGI